jgi:RNA polymerase sigma-70 factor, ECF subfamily
MESDFGAGVEHRIVNVLVSRDLLIWKADRLVCGGMLATSSGNPPDGPAHCPRGAIWLYTLRGGRPPRLRILHKHAAE